MKIPTLSKKEIQGAWIEKIVKIRKVWECFIEKKLGKGVIKKLIIEEAKARISHLKIKNPLKFVLELAINEKNLDGSKVQILNDRKRINFIIQECGYLRKEIKKRKKICCQPCSIGRINMARLLGFDARWSPLKKGCKMVIWK